MPIVEENREKSRGQVRGEKKRGDELGGVGVKVVMVMAAFATVVVLTVVAVTAVVVAEVDFV